MTIADYATKFKELSKLYPYYNRVEVKCSKCIKFESGLHQEIKQFIWYQEIRQFSVLVKKCRIYDEDNKVWSTHYKSTNEKKGKRLFRGKSYVTLDDKGK